MDNSLVKGQNVANESGKHTAFDEQHELITHNDEFDAHPPVMLLQGSKIEHRTAGAQTRVLLKPR